jgi:hypothetical protein
VPAEDLALLDDLVGPEGWNGPLVVSMPRTGSTLLGTLFLLASDPPGSGEHVFERYVHEPVAPVYWEGRTVADVVEGVGGRLTSRDIVQESAYQFADRGIAGWFLRQARPPVAFTVRDPRIAWPSRWRIMLKMRLAENPRPEERDRIERALEDQDYRELGGLLTQAVQPPGNGWAALLSLVDLSEAIPRVHMSDLASGPEYEWYYETTLSSEGGIIAKDRAPLPLDRFPDALRSRPPGRITIDRAVEWYRSLLGDHDVAGA